MSETPKPAPGVDPRVVTVALQDEMVASLNTLVELVGKQIPKGIAEPIKTPIISNSETEIESATPWFSITVKNDGNPVAGHPDVSVYVIVNTYAQELELEIRAGELREITYNTAAIRYFVIYTKVPGSQALVRCVGLR